MKDFPATFITYKNSPVGTAPVWILKFTADGTDYYISDNAFEVPSWDITTLGWATSWGQLQSGIGGTLDDFRVEDFDMEVLIDPDASPNMEDLAVGYPLEAAPVSLYLWFHGCSDPPQEMARCYIKDTDIPEETTVLLSVQDATLRLERAMIGSRLTRVVYPEADPDDVNKLIPIPFGSIARLPALAVKAGIQTSIPTAISALATSFAISDGYGLAAGDLIQIDDEQISITSIGGDTITACTRGAAGTIAAPHQKGAIVWQRKTSFDYLVSYIPLTAIPKVRAILGQTEVDITGICTRYTGQPGDEHASYPGKGVVTIPAYVTAAQAIDLLVTDGIGIDDAKTILDFIGLDDGIAVSDTITVSETAHTHTGVLGVIALSGDTGSSVLCSNAANMWDGDKGTSGVINSGGYIIVTRVQPQAGLGIPLRLRCGIYAHGSGYLYPTVAGVAGGSYLFYNAGVPRVVYSYWVDFTDWADLQNDTSLIAAYYSGTLTVYDCWFEVEYDPTPAEIAATVSRSGSASKTGTVTRTGDVTLGGTVSKTGTVTLSGNSVANTLVGDQILCDVVSPLTSIADVYGWLLTEAGYAGTFQQVGEWPACYVYDGVITEYRDVLYWLHELAFQSRAWFKFGPGTANLIYRTSDLVSAKTIGTCRIINGKKVHSREKTPYDEVLNTIQILYGRDWRQEKSDSAYTLEESDSHAGSIVDYGPRQRPELFQFDFVTDPDMAADLLAFFLSWYPFRHWLHSFDTFLNHAELEFGDIVTLGFSGDSVGQILETRPAPGNSDTSDIIGMVVVV